MRRTRSRDPWTDNSPLRRGLHRLVTVVLTLGLVLMGVFFGRLSVPRPAASQPFPAELAGATRMDGDVPVGYRKTPDGAVAAATNYSAVLAGPLILDPNRYREAEAVIASPLAQGHVMAEGEQAIAAVNDSTGAVAEAQRGVRVVVRYTPIAYRLTAYDAGSATVSIWGLWLVGEQGVLIPSETWSTRTVVLEWAGGDWKLAGSTTSPGPTPQLGQQPAQTSQLPPQLTDFEEYAHASH